MNMESKFEELENIINDEFVRDKVTDLKNISVEMFDCLIGLFIESLTIYENESPHFVNDWRNYYKREIEIIESATGKSIDEVIE
jgi:hypothetical protein